MSSFQPARRDFLHLLSGSAGAAWLAANWPALLSAAEHAHHAAMSGNAALEVFTAEQARELDSLTSRLIPTDDMPGAHEAGVVYFIDRALKTFAADALPTYKKGLETVQEITAQMFPGAARFSAASEEQQNQVVAKLFAQSGTKEEGPAIGPISDNKNFMETLRVHTIIGFLVDPEGGGNRDFAGWKTIGRDPAHTFAPPFGYYDKDYPGWQPAAAETEKK
jgi:gluconate 2-dehydrogenase gamma chain